MVGEDGDQPPGASDETDGDDGHRVDGTDRPRSAQSDEWGRVVEKAAEAILDVTRTIDPIVAVGGLIEFTAITTCAVIKIGSLNRYDIIGRVITRFVSAVEEHLGKDEEEDIETDREQPA